MDRWRQHREKSTGYSQHRMDLLYPVNMACALQLPVELQTLINRGFPVFPVTSYSHGVDPFSLTLEKSVEANTSGANCLRVLFQSITPSVGNFFTNEHKMSLLKTAIKKQHVTNLRILLDNILTTHELLSNGEGYELLMDVLSQSYGKNNCREMAKLLVKANCYYKKGFYSNNKVVTMETKTHLKYPTPLTLTILNHPALVETLLECGVPIYGQNRKIKAEDAIPRLKDAKSRRLYAALKDAQFSDVILAKQRLDAETLKIFTTYAAHEKEHISSLMFPVSSNYQKPARLLQ